ncbi:hypothetical protein V8E53_015472 [Lactarius tabidus]
MNYVLSPVPLPLPPPPALEPFPSLSQDEEELFDIAVRLDSALREFEARDSDVDTQFYVNCIIEELTDAEALCESGSPHMHPIIEYIGGEVAEAGRANEGLDLFSLTLRTAEEWCSEAAQHCPTETGVIHIPDLRPFVVRIPATHRWWLPPIPHSRTEDTEMAPPTRPHVPVPASGSGPTSASTSASASTSTRTSSRARAPVVYADVHDDDDDIDMGERGEETPRRQTRSSSKHAVTSPTAEAPDPQRPRVVDPDACGQCAARYQLCEPFEQRVTALACNFCTIQKIRCYPKAKWAQEEEEAQETQKIEDQKKPNKGKGKKQNVVVESVDNLSSAIDSLKSKVSELRSDFNTKLAEASQEIVKLQSEFGTRIGEASQEIVELRKYSLQQDQMLRGLCLQAGVSVSSLNLRIPPPSTRLQIPPAPTHDEQAASTPSASSVISNVSSTSSHLHLGSLMIDSPTPGTASLPLAGPSGSGSGVQRAQIRAKDEIVRTTSGQSVAPSRPPSAQSVVGSRRASHTRS